MIFHFGFSLSPLIGPVEASHIIVKITKSAHSLKQIELDGIEVEKYSDFQIFNFKIQTL